jgi:beta-N-acetylhexosaminidase
MDDAHLAGQLILMGIPSTTLADSARTVLAADHVGGIFMFGNSSEGVAHTREVTDAARRADRDAHLMVTADQEGGQIQRLRGPGFDRMPAAIDQADLSDRALTQRAEVWGSQLDDAGVDTDLAPVADVVPADIGAANKPIYALQRGYGASPAAVAPKVVAYIEGMHAAGRGTTLKHFPGLGQVRGNTDFVRDVTDSRTTRDDALLAPFRKGIAARADMVMVALATYSKIDARQSAAFSATIITDMLRGDLGFHGVVVSDDMNALQVRNLSASARAWRFLEAGGDLITIGDPAVAHDMARNIRDRMGGSDAVRQRVRDSAVRVLTMKARLGLLRCG